MRPLTHSTLLFCCLLVAPALAGDAVSADAKALQGAWKVVGLEVQGKKAPPEAFAGGHVIVKGDEMFLGDRKVKFKLDPGKTPRAIDLIPQDGPDKGKTIRGIYALEKGRLKLCAPNFAGDTNKRPAEFRTTPGDGLGLLILERPGR
jgi:RNA polymerase sigma-70 factor (ECF subfamily)